MGDSPCTRALPRWGSGWLVWSTALALCACSDPRAKAPSKAPEPVSRAAPQDAAPPLVIRPRSLRAGVELLSSDRMAGRYTISDQIHHAARWLSGQYRGAKIPSAVGKDYLHRYTLELGRQETAVPSLSFRISGKNPEPQRESSIATVDSGQAGSASGQVVFVGYGIEQEGGKFPLRELSGLNLKGKIALLLDGVPGDLEFDDIITRAEDIAELYDSKLHAHPGMSAKDRGALLRSARMSLFKILCSYIPRESLPSDYFKIPARAPLGITSEDLLEPLWPAIRQQEAKRQRLAPVELSHKLADLKRAGAVGAIVVRGPASFLDSQAQARERLPGFSLAQSPVLQGEPTLPAVYLKSSVAQRWLEKQGISLARLQQSVDLSLRSHSVGIPGLAATITVGIEQESVEAPNVVAVIPGSDLAKEIVVVSAHFDHIGTAKNSPLCEASGQGRRLDEICNGADDNASGTMAVLEVARAFRRAGHTPRRTVVFAHFSGEELGLLGSTALVRDEAIQLSRIVAVINIDMIGRLGDRALKVGGLATSPQWQGLLEGLDSRGVPLEFDASTTQRSDHAPFVERKIPALFFFSGLHDKYHQAGDEVRTLDFKRYPRIVQMIADLVSELGQGAPLKWSEPPPGQGLVMELPGENPKNQIRRSTGKPAKKPRSR